MQQEPIRYFSTNEAIFGTPDLQRRLEDSSLKTVGLAEALIVGQAPDGGLFMPTRIPRFSQEQIESLMGLPYPAMFVKVVGPFFNGVFQPGTLERIAEEAYTFEPFKEPVRGNDYISRLDEGPTAAFKDYAAQVLFRFVEALLTEEPTSEIEFRKNMKAIELLSYITATSGDTGGATGVGCLDKQRMWMAILHSSHIPDEISELQAKQMDTLGNNVYSLWVDTNFDGCQDIAQRLLKDPELKYLNPTSANSINIGRLLPQIAYYFFSYFKVADPGEQVYVSVPSGNFGDAVAGLFAQQMGLPIKLIIAVNGNDVFKRFYDNGLYKPAAGAVDCPSNAMIVNMPSNMRRLFQLYGGQIVEGNNSEGHKVVSKIVPPDMDRIREDMAAFSVSNPETIDAIFRFYGLQHLIEGSLHSTIEPHTAVGWRAAEKLREQGYDGKIITLGTAHPGKFPEVLEKHNIHPQLPECLKKLVNVPHGRHFIIPNSYAVAKAVVQSLYAQELERQRSKS